MSATPQKRILVVEDDPSTAKMMGMQLHQVGFDVHLEDSGVSALSYAVEHKPDLVVLDVKLPDMNGYEVCKELRQQTNPWVPPILMLTGMDQPIDQLRGFAHGADAYVTKPYDSDELVKTIKLLLGELALD